MILAFILNSNFVTEISFRIISNYAPPRTMNSEWNQMVRGVAALLSNFFHRWIISLIDEIAFSFPNKKKEEKNTKKLRWWIVNFWKCNFLFCVNFIDEFITQIVDFYIDQLSWTEFISFVQPNETLFFLHFNIQTTTVK